MRAPLSLVLVALAGAAAASEAAPQVGVIRFVPVEVSPEFAATVEGAVANELDRLGAFRVSTAQSIADLLALERQKQLLGCGEDESCMAEIVDALGLDYMIAGKVVRAGDRWSAELTLSSVRASKREGSQLVEASGPDALLDAVRDGTRRLVATLLRARSGALVVKVSEPGATVKIDDIAVGVTPLAQALTLPAGPRRITVEKKGFLAAEAEVRIQPGQSRDYAVTLVPSADFLREYQARHRRMRQAAWITTGSAVAGLVTGGVMQLRAQLLHGSTTTPGTFLYYRQLLLDGQQTEGTTDIRSEALRLGAEIKTAETVGHVAFAVAGIAAAGAAFFWIAGDDPDRYRTKPGAISWSLTPSPEGFGAAITLRLP